MVGPRGAAPPAAKPQTLPSAVGLQADILTSVDWTGFVQVRSEQKVFSNRKTYKKFSFLLNGIVNGSHLDFNLVYIGFEPTSPPNCSRDTLSS